MKEITTTLAAIKKRKLYRPDWKTLLTSLNKTKADDEPLSLLHILSFNGLNVAIRALRTVDKQYDPAIRLYACFLVRCGLPVFEKAYPEDMRPRQAIEATENFLKGAGTKEAWAAASESVTLACSTVEFEKGCSTVEAVVNAASWATNNSPYAARAVFWAARHATRYAFAAEAIFTKEFKRFCRLEGDYGAVLKARN